jgi:hypothetical protein
MPPELRSTDETLFLCLARDCESNLPRFFQYLETMRSAGLPCRAIIGENGSRDRTRSLIVEASNRGISLLDTAAMASIPSRLARMAAGRELLLQAARDAQVPSFVCVADLDNVIEKPPAIDALVGGMQRLRDDPGLFAIGATSRPVYYDLLALRMKGYDFSTLDAEIAEAKKRPLTYHSFHRRRIYKNQRALTTPSPILCESSFNGFCLYRGTDYMLGSYRGPLEASICEHVTMNLSIGQATGRQMLIAPDLIVQTPSDHAPVGLARFWIDRLRKSVSH